MAKRFSPVPALIEYRAQKGLTQAKLGEELGVTDVTVSRWETGQRKVDDDLLPIVSEKTGIPQLKLRPDLERMVKQAEGAPQ